MEFTSEPIWAWRFLFQKLTNYWFSFFIGCRPVQIASFSDAFALLWKLLSRVRLCDSVDCTVHGVLQVRILEVGCLFPSPGDLPNPGIEPRSPRIAGGFFNSWAARVLANCVFQGTGPFHLGFQIYGHRFVHSIPLAHGTYSGDPSLISDFSNFILSLLFLVNLARPINFIELFKEAPFGFTDSPPHPQDFLFSLSLVSALICITSFFSALFWI